MRVFLFAVVACLVGAAARPVIADETADKAELAKLQGAWVFESVSTDGKKEMIPPEAEIRFEGTQIISKMGGKSDKGKFKLNNTTNPKQIDLTTDDGGMKEVTEAGIYELTDDTLKLCVAEGEVAIGENDAQNPKEGKRPTAFDDKQGVLIVLKRKPK